MLIFYLFLSIGVSFLCSLFEAVILSITPAFVAAYKDSGRRTGKLLEKLKNNLDDSLAAILTLNTIAHTIGAAGVGAEVLKIYGSAYVALASAILTVLILVLSEIIPKTLGASYYPSLSGFSAYGIQVFIFLTYPFVAFFKLLSRMLGSSGHSQALSRDEILFSAQLGHERGNLTADEARIIKNLLQLRKVLIRDVMTPRTVVFALEENKTVGQVFEELKTTPFSRIPIYSEKIDQISGLVTKYNLLKAALDRKTDLKLSTFSKPIHKVPDLMNIGQAYEEFVSRGDHIFAVYDEHGSFDGIITLEDVIETMLGIEITDELDSVEDMRAYAAKEWAKRRSKQ